LEADATWELGIVAIVVVDEEELWPCGGGRHLDDLLVGGAGASVEHVDEGLLLGGRHDNGVAATDGVGGAYEDVVEVDLGVVDGAGAEGLLGLLGGAVQVQVAGDLSLDAATVGTADLAAAASVAERDSAAAAAESSAAA